MLHFIRKLGIIFDQWHTKAILITNQKQYEEIHC